MVELPLRGVDLRAFLLRVEFALIVQALERTSNHKTHAAEILHIKRSTLIEKMRRLGLPLCVKTRQTPDTGSLKDRANAHTKRVQAKKKKRARLKPKLEIQKEEIIHRVMGLMGWDADRAAVWYRTSNPNFGGASADHLVQMNRGRKVLAFIESAEKESKPAA